jgi:uncharacterized membrane protein YeaQ/YmgE (transglycosylase-associated protein family)
MGWLAWIIVGAIAGWLAGKVMKSGGGVLTDIIVGIIGSFIGGFIANVLGFGGAMNITIGSILVSLVGAAVLLLAIHTLNGHRLFSR